MATVRHVTAWAGRTKYQADGILFDRLYVLHKVHVNGESPFFVQYSEWNREKLENLKVSNSIKISIHLNSILKYLPMNFLTPNIVTWCREDLLSDGPLVTDEIVSFWPSHEPSISSPKANMFPVAPYSNTYHALPLKFHILFLSGMNWNYRRVSGVSKDSPRIVG